MQTLAFHSNPTDSIEITESETFTSEARPASAEIIPLQQPTEKFSAKNALMAQLIDLFEQTENEAEDIKQRYSLGGLFNQAKQAICLQNLKKSARSIAKGKIDHYPNKLSYLDKKMAFEMFDLLLCEI